MRAIYTMPATLGNALGIMIYGMFLAIIIPAMQEGTSDSCGRSVVAGCRPGSCIIHFVPVFSFITDGFSIIICAVGSIPR
ncbi:MAG: hypothetical protein ACLTDC_08485 [Lachnospiraceae bacterium]